MPSLIAKGPPSKVVETLDDAFWSNDDVIEQKPPLIRRIFNGETHRAQLLKLLALLALAVVHLIYMNPFIVSFRAFEELSHQVESETFFPSNQIDDVIAMRHLMSQLINYKKNLWITVGAMCCSLATSAFLLLLLEHAKVHKAVNAIVRLVDVSFFVALPVLLAARRAIAVGLPRRMDAGLEAANRVADTNNFINTLTCSIVERENLPNCSSVMLQSIFPVKVLEYLIILCVLTGAYMALAYLIEYCIRHWFPPSRRSTSDNQKQPLVLPQV